jgi:4-amino-4-deoxy-L-arabinose transferase-like glycosyltransferase
MRILIWTWRVVLAVVVGTFIATAYYMTHPGTNMRGTMAALELVSVIGAGVLGLVWTLAKRYWHALILLIVLGLLGGLFRFTGETPEHGLLTEFQSIFVFVAIGVVALVFVITLTARALVADRALKAVRQAGAVQVAVEAPGVALPVAVPASVSAVGRDTAATEVTEDAAAGRRGAARDSYADDSTDK